MHLVPDVLLFLSIPLVSLIEVGRHRFWSYPKCSAKYHVKEHSRVLHFSRRRTKIGLDRNADGGGDYK